MWPREPGMSHLVLPLTFIYLISYVFIYFNHRTRYSPTKLQLNVARHRDRGRQPLLSSFKLSFKMFEVWNQFFDQQVKVICELIVHWCLCIMCIWWWGVEALQPNLWGLFAIYKQSFLRIPLNVYYSDWQDHFSYWWDATINIFNAIAQCYGHYKQNIIHLHSTSERYWLFLVARSQARWMGKVAF